MAKKGPFFGPGGPNFDRRGDIPSAAVPIRPLSVRSADGQVKKPGRTADGQRTDNADGQRTDSGRMRTDSGRTADGCGRTADGQRTDNADGQCGRTADSK